MTAVPRATIGMAIVLGHAALFGVLAERCGGGELAVDVSTPAGSAVPADRVSIDDRDAPEGPGMQHRRWTVAYRGGFTRSVGATHLEGPYQQPSALACSGRVVVGQKLLDAGLTDAIVTQLNAELKGEGVFPIGEFERVKDAKIQWARVESRPADAKLVGAAPHGYVRFSATIAFARVEVPVVVALIPEPKGGAITFRIASKAELAFGNRVVQWLSDKLGGDRLATFFAKHQIDDALVTSLAPPPPFELPGGQLLKFSYCNEPPEIADGAWAAMPFAVEIAANPSAPVLPPRLGPGPRPTPRATTSLALDLDVDALDALLYELWRTGYLDRQLERVGLDRRFNTDPTVVEFLSLRISPVSLALPPIVSGTSRGLRLATESRTTIHDGDDHTTGRVWGAIDFSFDRPAGAPGTTLPITATLGALELSCEKSHDVLVPCYGDLVAALRDRGDELQGALTTAFVGLLGDIFVDRRLGAAGMPVDIVIKSAVPSVTTCGSNATLHLELDAALSR